MGIENTIPHYLQHTHTRARVPVHTKHGTPVDIACSGNPTTKIIHMK